MVEETEDLTYQNIIELFLKDFPEFRDKAEEDKVFWQEEEDEKPLIHVFFGDILNPFLVNEALIKTDDTALIKRLFQFMEKMSVSKDVKVQEVLGVTILEGLGDDRKILKKARKFMRPETLKMSHEIEKGLGRE